MKYDGTYQKLFSNPEMIEDLVKNFVKEKWVQDLDFTTLERFSSKFFSEELTKREGDLIFRINTFNGRPTYLMILLEFQSSQDHWMVVRFLVYIGLLYQQLIKDKQLIKGLLPPVFPIVLYNGDPKWEAKQDLKKLIELPAKSKLWPYQPKLRYYVVDEKEHVNNNLTSLSGLLFKLEKNKDNQNFELYLNQLLDLLSRPEYSQIGQDFLTWIRHVLEPSKQLELNFGQIESISEARDMLRENIKRWEQEFFQQGTERGIYLGEIKIIERLLQKRFGPASPEVYEKLRNASQEELEEWSIRILEAHTIDDVFKN